jgi:hypothetical protein
LFRSQEDADDAGYWKIETCGNPAPEALIEEQEVSLDLDCKPDCLCFSRIEL